MSDPVTITPNLNDAVTAAQSLLQQTTEQAIAAATSAAVATTASASIIYDHIYGLYGIDPTLRPRRSRRGSLRAARRCRTVISISTPLISN